MLNFALPLIFLLVSWGVGLGFYRFFPKPNDISRALTPVLGLAILVVFTSYLYQFGIQTEQIGLVIYVLSMFFLIWQIDSIRPSLRISRLKESFGNILSVFVILVSGFLLLVSPAVVGGTNFKIFQGNHWDSLSYMGITQSISSHSFHDLTSISGITLIDPVTTLATSSMRARPNVEILLASFLSPLDLSILDYSYSFAIFLTLILGCAMWALFDYFKPKDSVRRVALSVFLVSAFLVGFWGQYFIDINAWSSAAAIPLMISIFITKSAWLLKIDLKRGLVLGIFLISSILVYPESFLFFSPLIFLFAVFTIRRNKIRFTVNLHWFVLLYALVTLILFTSKYQPLMFGISQLKFGSSDASAPWGPYFQAYLGGDQGLSYSSGLNFIRTIPSGLLGLYFLSPTELATSNPQDVLILILNCVFIFVFILLIARLIKFAKWSSVGLITLFGMSLVPLLILISTLWTAGKAINYMIAFAFIMVLIDVFSTNFRSRQRKILVTSLLIGWGMLQISFAVSRIQTVQLDYSPHSFPPYVSIQNANLKTQQSWVFPITNDKNKCKVIELDITEPFQRYYAQMRLNESGGRWYDKNPINTYFGNGTDIGNMKQLKLANFCLLQNSLNREKTGFEFTLVQKR